MKPWRIAPLQRAGLVLLVVAVGLSAGVGGVAVLNRDGGTKRRPAVPSVSAFRFQTAGPIAAVSSGPAPASSAEPTSARGAVEAFLIAERDGDADAGYHLLAGADQSAVGSRQAWAATRPDRPRPIGFQVGGEQPNADGVDVIVTVTRQPSLDPFNGFVSARATQTWRAVQEGAAWRVRAAPVAEQPQLPPTAAATAPAAAWVQALARCDLAGAARLQGGTELYGSFDLVGTPCQEHGAWTAGAPVGVDRAPDVQLLLEAYGPDLSSWARLVPVQGPRSHFFAAVAPVGDDWRVIGVTDDGG